MFRNVLWITTAACLVFCPFPAVAARGLPALIDLSTPASYASILRIYGNYSNGVAGISVFAKDINGDGLEDVILGALRSSPQERNQAGEAYVVFGSKQWRTEDIVDLNDPPPGVLRIHGAEPEMQFGRSVVAGDMDKDGYNDLIISAWYASPSERPRSGMLYIIFGSPALYSAGVIDLRESRPDVIPVYGENAGDEFGVLIYVGDVDGDGFADAVAGAMTADPLNRSNAGKCYVIFGSADIRTRGPIDTRDRSRVLSIVGERPGDGLGYHVTAGDLNNDGADEVILCARYGDPLYRNDAGEVYILFGAPDLQTKGEIDLADSKAPVLRVYGANPGDYTGDRMNVGDLDGDGFGDALIDVSASDSVNGNNTGRVYVLFGSADMAQRASIDLRTRDWPMVSMFGENDEDLLNMPFAGDVNGDGIDDITVLAHSADFRGLSKVGAGYTLFGSKDFRSLGDINLRNPPVDIVRIQGDEGNGYLGISGAAGDIDKDGYADMIIPAHNANPEGRASAGKVYVIWGGPYQEFSEEPIHFFFASDTGDSATVTFRKESPPQVYGTPIVKGDEIGVVTPSGFCAGAGVWTGSDLSITIWGDNTKTYKLDGFRKGEPLGFRIWKNKENREYVATPLYATSTAAYWPGTIIEITSLKATGTPTAVNEERPQPVSLAQNIPNPFNPSTTVAFTLPKAARVTLTVFNTLGAKIETLAEGDFAAGEHQVVWNARDHAGGVYFCRLDAGGFTETRKMLLVK